MDSSNSNLTEVSLSPESGATLVQLGIRTLQQLQGRVAELSTTEYIIDGLIPQQSIALVVGDSGLGKSPLLYQASLCVASGFHSLVRKCARAGSYTSTAKTGPPK